MELFELLFIALFLLFPILEQVLRRRKGSGPDEPGPDPMETEEGRIEPRSSSREPVKASEMVPDDLWAVLTGEARHREGVDREGEADRAGREWSSGESEGVAASAEPTTAEPETAEVPDWEDAWTPRPEPGWALDEEVDDREPVSLEYRGPEARSLEELDFRPIERSVPSPESRHRRFHEMIEQPRPRHRARRSAVGRALSSPRSLRQAFILSEVLGAPKGIE